MNITIDVHHHFHNEADQRIMSALGLLQVSIDALKTQGEANMAAVNADFSALMDQAKKNEDAEDAAITLLASLAAKIEAGATDPVAMRQLATDLKTHGDALAAAIVVNTPADPGPTPDPAGGPT